MAKNFVEYHTQEGAFHTFHVASGEVVKIGQFVEISGDMEVKPATQDSEKVVGMVYSGTVGVEGREYGYHGDQNHKATVVVLKPFTFAETEANVTAGDSLKVTANGNVTPMDFAGGDTIFMKVATALKSANSGDRVLILHK
ncbi:hypothetical protein DXT76_01110 [Halobacillus trueperi]|uniref:DUF2190 family protein n=1 Tax=Halobacillus trueperi TaxID=156205 RepID=A0A3D8VSR2_9BACI|nr:hypothetical protein [Halobacillus trueperi]RDY72569.1 hypothetical protein DXT76_01110 [Halobacillus trueperi]